MYVQDSYLVPLDIFLSAAFLAFSLFFLIYSRLVLPLAGGS